MSAGIVRPAAMAVAGSRDSHPGLVLAIVLASYLMIHTVAPHTAISIASARCRVSHQGTATSPRLFDVRPPASTSA